MEMFVRYLVVMLLLTSVSAFAQQKSIDEARGVLDACRTSFGACGKMDKFNNCAWSYDLPECADVERQFNTLKGQKDEADKKDVQKVKDRERIMKFLGKSS
jgi:hypothetical protein